MKKFLTIFLLLFVAIFLVSCEYKETSNRMETQNQDKQTLEAYKQTGLPALTQFRERKLLKSIYEMRDKEICTYVYLENMVPTVVKGHTACGGKLQFIGEAVGFGVPYSTQYSASRKLEQIHGGSEYYEMNQSEPNGLYSPGSADGTWIMMKGPDGKLHAVMLEPKTITSPFPFPLD